MYLNPNEGYLGILLSASSFSDFSGRIDSLVKIVEYDKNFIISMETKKKILENQRSEFDKKKKETVTFKAA